MTDICHMPEPSKTKQTSTGGFTLLELLVVIVMAGTLAAIAAPGWISFMNRQRANAVRDEMLQLIQAAQSSAQQDNSGYEVHLDPTVGSSALIIAKDVTSGASDIGTGLRTALGEEPSRANLQIKAEDIDGFEVEAFVFDHRGRIKYVSAPSAGGEGTLPLAISSKLGDANAPERCIVVTTLIGNMVTAEGEDCENLNYVPDP